MQVKWLGASDLKLAVSNLSLLFLGVNTRVRVNVWFPDLVIVGIVIS